jgi:ADP-heptose:LPS heptosyltransferase
MLLGIFENTTEYKIVCVGGETDFAVDHPLVVNYNGRYSPAELTYLLDHAECFVGIDSGPFHCAGASSTPILALLNHVHPEYILPYRNGTLGSNCHVIQAAVDCLGCHARQAVPVRSIKCEKNNFPCNSTWDGKQISKKILEIISV